MKITLVTIATLMLGSCGYRVGGRADLIPHSIQTIAIPAFQNISYEYKLSDLMPSELDKEFESRTRFHVVHDADQADAILRGSISRVQRLGSLSDPTTGKTVSVQIRVTMNIALIERATGKVLYKRDNFDVVDYYEIATDPHQLVDESGAAFQRLSRTFARDIVSAILEDF